MEKIKDTRGYYPYINEEVKKGRTVVTYHTSGGLIWVFSFDETHKPELNKPKQHTNLKKYKIKEDGSLEKSPLEPDLKEYDHAYVKNVYQAKLLGVEMLQKLSGYTYFSQKEKEKK